MLEVIREFCKKNFIKENIKESSERLVCIHKQWQEWNGGSQNLLKRLYKDRIYYHYFYCLSYNNGKDHQSNIDIPQFIFRFIYFIRIRATIMNFTVKRGFLSLKYSSNYSAQKKCPVSWVLIWSPIFSLKVKNISGKIYLINIRVNLNSEY